MYSAWAAKKRSIIILSVSVIGFVFFSIYIVIKMYQPPSCYDNKMNQEEVGIDCGGPCALMCSSQIFPVKTLWTRSFEVTDSMWSLISYAENPNPASFSHKADYKFRLFDRDDILIKEVEGSTFLTHDPIVPVFEGRVDVADWVPYRTEFEWVGTPVWYRIENVYEVAIEEKTLTNTAERPTIQARLVNKEPYLLEDIEVIAIVYGIDKNAIAVSKTYVDRLSPRGKRNIVFSWPNPFAKEAERIQIVTRIPPQSE
jgi:hypothetical protein